MDGFNLRHCRVVLITRFTNFCFPKRLATSKAQITSWKPLWGADDVPYLYGMDWCSLLPMRILYSTWHRSHAVLTQDRSPVLSVIFFVTLLTFFTSFEQFWLLRQLSPYHGHADGFNLKQDGILGDHLTIETPKKSFETEKYMFTRIVLYFITWNECILQHTVLLTREKL